jgi:hypothetical protein
MADFAADPNEHYRPWLEENVGKQGWDWDWGLYDEDVKRNTLTIKIRKKHAKFVIIAVMMWT